MSKKNEPDKKDTGKRETGKKEVDQEKLLSVLCDMNPDEDDQWLQSGEPRLSYLEKAVGGEVTQALVQKVYHGFSRETLAEMDEKASNEPENGTDEAAKEDSSEEPDAPGGNPLVPEITSTKKTECGVPVVTREVVAVLENSDDEQDETFQNIQDELRLLEDAAQRQRIRRDKAIEELALIQVQIDEKMAERNSRFPPKSQAAMIKDFTARQLQNRRERMEAAQAVGQKVVSPLDQSLQHKKSRPNFAGAVAKKE